MSSQKTNKSYTKRLKLTRTGKILVRKAGRNHFNAKESRSKQLARARGRSITLSVKVKNLNLPHA
ncbi:MAG: 50S ribosomal protein L35 [Candidatus Pacebacteria bacterium]|nr:50S ribosomal protein L35 [Candidatus Paceibacterota bacterium]